ncbi:MAG: thioredoxin fold domain-containing protein [Betaproteobacteria bacterium]|nr:thioredoxin fold domain-containing protein [Betaproteobacteria bacterium]
MTRRIAVVLLAAALAACGKTEPPPNPQAPKDAPAPASPAQAYRDAARGAGISVGQTMAKDVVYVFFDPQCPHCAAMWQAAQPILGEVRMVWIPVAFINSLSAPQGAALLGAPDPAAAIDAHETKVNQGDYGAMPAKVPPELLREVQSNTKLWTGIGADVVPYVLYEDAQTGKAGIISGQLPTAELKQRLGLP